MQHTISVGEASDKMPLFVRHLLEMDPRIRLHQFVGDVERGKGFFIDNNVIHLPYILPTIEHEIAHAVEMNNPKRWTLDDWGLGVRSNFLEIASTKGLFAAAAREMRVRAIQHRMDASRFGNLLSNVHWKWALEHRLPFGRFKTPQDIQVWNDNLRERTLQAWNLDRIEDAWKVRLTHIQHWMETHGSTSTLRSNS